jgi:nitrogen-specific signal transduction histidine kinase
LNLWRDIIDSLTDAILVLSPALEPQVVNPAAETMLAVSPVSASTIADLLRQNDWLARMVVTCLATGQDLGHPETVLTIGPRELTVRAEVAPLLGAEEPQRPQEPVQEPAQEPAQERAQEHAQEHTGDAPEHPPDGNRPGGVVVLLHDLSHEREAAEAASSGDLSLRLSPAGLAHEVKNPLTGIKGAAELMAGMYPDDGRAQQYCGVILDGVERIASLVEQVLAVSAPTRMAQEPVNIHQVLHSAMRMAGLLPNPPPNLLILQDFDPSLPDVLGDSGALERVFLNLIKNAIEAMDPSGTIRLHTRIETEFRMTAGGQRRQFLRVEISDTGAGISEEQLAQLFTPFFTTKPAGTGLGLVLCQRIIALHGGRLWAQRGGVDRNKEGPSSKEGMTFKITLPVVTPVQRSE